MIIQSGSVVWFVKLTTYHLVNVLKSFGPTVAALLSIYIHTCMLHGAHRNKYTYIHTYIHAHKNTQMCCRLDGDFVIGIFLRVFL